MKPQKFEQAMSQLEEMVQKLEGGELLLDQSIQAFEEGMGLAKYCEDKLKEAQGRIEILLKEAEKKDD